MASPAATWASGLSNSTWSLNALTQPDQLLYFAQESVLSVWDGTFMALTAIGRAVYYVMLFWSLSFPTRLVSYFSTTLTITFSFTTLLVLILGITSFVSWMLRYRFLQDPLEPQPRRARYMDLSPPTESEEPKDGGSNYLDEFLSAIKVFGYLERPVFHELTRTMHTKKLAPGETLLLEEETGFCLVVDGLVQIFVRSRREDIGQDGSDGEEDLQDSKDDAYRLLTEVTNGAPMSSLFSILSLFTEDVKLPSDDTRLLEILRPPRRSSRHTSRPRTATQESESISVPATPSQAGRDSSRNAPLEDYFQQSTTTGLPAVPAMSLDEPYTGGVTPSPHPSPAIRQKGSKGKPRKSVHPEVLARATVETTIAIIPASAFRRLTRIYPKASSHIVQVIVSRLQRVTLASSLNYLGLTTEVLSLEKYLSHLTACDLPDSLRGDALARLKDKFHREKARIGAEEAKNGIALHNPASKNRRSSSSLRKEAANHALAAAAAKERGNDTKPDRSRPVIKPSPSSLHRQHHPTFESDEMFSGEWSGTEAPLQSPLAARVRNPFSAGQATPGPTKMSSHPNEAERFRESVLACLFRAIGLTTDHDHVGRHATVEDSPMLGSSDTRQRAFSSALGFMDPYESSTEGDTDSVASTSGHHGVNLPIELKDEIEIVYFPAGSVLVEQGERTPGLYYVIDGFLDIGIPCEAKTQSDVHTSVSISSLLNHQTRTSSPSAHRSTSKPSKATQRISRRIYVTKPGEVAGYMDTVSSYRSLVDVVAKTDVCVGFLARTAVERLAEKYPVVLLTLAKRITNVLPRVIRHIDFALEWKQVDAGQYLFNRGDESDSIYIVLNGRLRSMIEKEDGTRNGIAEFGQGESVGEFEVITNNPRASTIHAIRDTELVRLPKTLINSLAMEHPTITLKMSRLLASKVKSLLDDPLAERSSSMSPLVRGATSTLNFRTVAILPVTAGVPVSDFAFKLSNALAQIGLADGVTTLNQAVILNHLGKHAFSRMGKLKLAQYLADLEEKYDMILYVADTSVNAPWTQTCVSQADCILLVGLGEGSPEIGEYEKYLLNSKTTARRDLVLLHLERYVRWGTTRRWLRDRIWITGGHHHIQMDFRSAQLSQRPRNKRFGTALRQRVQLLHAEFQRYTGRRIEATPLYSSESPMKGDFHRLARRICGKSIGLVLGGGGARGLAHVGVVRALEEAGIPIDMVGGCSIGAFMGGLYARDADVVPMFGRAKAFAGRMGSLWRFVLDLTYPSVSYTTGYEFNRNIFKAFGRSQIEDFWLEYYCNTTNVTQSCAEYHSSGYAWRYVRGSMTLAGLLPPICEQGSMLLDGGYVDNLPVAHMKSLGAETIFAVDVGSLDDQTPHRYGDSLSGWWFLTNKLNPFSTTASPPSLSELQSRLAYVASVDSLERAKKMPGCLYMRPPIDGYGTLEFGKFDEISDVGYKFAKRFISGLREKGLLPIAEMGREEGDAEDGEDGEHRGRPLKRMQAGRRASV